MRKAGVIFFIVFVHRLCIYSQENISAFNPYLQVQQPSPEAEKYSQLAEIPVDLYTGKVNIDIPLYTIVHNDIRIPVSLSYNGGGVKVSDESGVVGLGWTLNASGVISRVLRGMPDELFDSSNKKGGYARMSELVMTDGLSNFEDYINLIKHSNQDRDPIALGHPYSQQDLYKVYMTGRYQDKYDEMRFESSPDNYIFKAYDLSGAFAKYHNHLILQSNSGCSVSFDMFTPTITDANGCQYSFNALESKDYLYKLGFVFWKKECWDTAQLYRYDYTSAWWLTKIKSMSGDSIDFSYTNVKIGHRRPCYHGYTQIEHCYYNTFLDRVESRNVTQHYHSEYYEMKDSVNHMLLSRINFYEGYVDFYYAAVDQYHSYTPHIDSISVFANGQSSPIRRIHFSYIGGNGKEHLIGISIIGSTDKTQNYRFTYHNPIFIPLESNKYDHWGYYSSASDALFPGGTYFDIRVDYPGKYRYADNANADNNMLKTITYPTGGKINFDWEPHDFSVYSSLGQQAIHEMPQSNYNTQQTYIVDDRYTLCGKLNHEHLSETIAVSSNQIVKVDLTNYYNFANNNLPNSNNGYAACIYSQNYFPFIIVSRNDMEVTRINISKDITEYNANRVRWLNLQAGTYTFTLVNPRSGIISNCLDYEWIFNMYGADTSLDGTLNIEVGHYQSGTSGSEMKDHVGGVRIKTITYKTGNNTAYRKEYTYKTDSGLSSGVLAYPPRYASKRIYCDSVIIPPDNNAGVAGAYLVECPPMITLRSCGLPFVLNSDGHIGYKQVTESIVHDNISVNKTVYKFQTADYLNYSDINDTEQFYESFVPTDMLQLTSQSYLRGHLTEKIEFADEHKTTTYIYDIQENAENDTLTGAIFPIAEYRERDMFNYNGTMVNPTKDLGIVKYRIIPYNKRIARMMTIGEKSDEYHSYTYANNTYSSARNANMPVTHSFVNSEGDTIIQHYTYHLNMKKIESCVTTKNGYVTNAYRYEYDSCGRISSRYETLLRASSLPAYSTFDIEDDINELVERYFYHNNRLSEVTNYPSNMTTVYLWSYHNSYPIAEIKNATFNEIVGELGEDVIDETAMATSPDMETVDNLRAEMPQCMIVTRTYKPLVGTTSETDAAGHTTFYDYDGFGRLQKVYIVENNNVQILKQYEYKLSD